MRVILLKEFDWLNAQPAHKSVFMYVRVVFGSPNWSADRYISLNGKL